MIILYGPSACGKTEVAKLLASSYSIKKVITHTTRSKRVNEVNGVDYYFVTKEEFLSLKEQGAFVETACYNFNLYGSSKKEIQDDKCCILDPQGVKKYKELNDKSIVIFYLTASEETRKKRMESRLDKKEDISSRLQNDKESFKDVDELADFIISTEERSVDDITKEVYEKYLSLKK